MAQINYRTINVDAYDPESPQNFDLATLAPSVVPVSTADVQNTAVQIRQLLRSGDSEGALRSALEMAPFGAEAAGKDVHTQLLIEILQSIRASDMSPLLSRLYQSPGGPELLDTLMKYLYKGMGAGAGAGGAGGSKSRGNLTPQGTGFSQIGGRPSTGDGGGMSVLLSWHEKLVELAGPGNESPQTRTTPTIDARDIRATPSSRFELRERAVRELSVTPLQQEDKRIRSEHYKPPTNGRQRRPLKHYEATAGFHRR
ncbi:MAG: hypothetical protein Q9162_002699 [Coniocarpon cinnabarinum]